MSLMILSLVVIGFSCSRFVLLVVLYYDDGDDYGYSDVPVLWKLLTK